MGNDLFNCVFIVVFVYIFKGMIELDIFRNVVNLISCINKRKMIKFVRCFFEDKYFVVWIFFF